MTATICAFCKKHAHMTYLRGERYWREEDDFIQALAVCDSCGRYSLAEFESFLSQGSTAQEKFESIDDSDVLWTPREGAHPTFPDVPSHIASAAQEAHSAFSIGARMAAVLMARTVVEATAKEKGITKGTLLSKIDELAKQSIIRDGTREAAHEIRHLGNDMAHGDIEDLPHANDVRDVLDLMDEVLNEVFQGPAKTARLRARRATN